MPVVPSFSGYAQTPNLAQAYLGGRRIAVEREAIAQRANEAASRIALARQELAQEAVANEMRLAATQQAQAREAMQAAQEAEIAKSYRDIQLGMAQRKLALDEQSAAMELQEAARGFDMNQRFQKRFSELSATLGPEQAATRALLEIGPQAGGGFTRSVSPPQREPTVSVPIYPEGTDPVVARAMGIPATTVRGSVNQLATMLGTNMPTALRQPSQPKVGAPSSEVIRRTKDGRRAVFDADTKQFIRYLQ